VLIELIAIFSGVYLSGGGGGGGGKGNEDVINCHQTIMNQGATRSRDEV
jgi:hypothetical protein